jgi:hypothetical protein
MERCAAGPPNAVDHCRNALRATGAENPPVAFDCRWRAVAFSDAAAGTCDEHYLARDVAASFVIGFSVLPMGTITAEKS